MTADREAFAQALDVIEDNLLFAIPTYLQLSVKDAVREGRALLAADERGATDAEHAYALSEIERLRQRLDSIRRDLDNALTTLDADD